MKTRWRKGQETNAEWLAKHISYEGDDCLIWPFSRIPAGYGMLGYKGGHWRANRLMCVWAHGEPPTPKHQAAHSCDNGHGGCVNPRHLSWKTNQENQLDRKRAGTTATNKHGNKGALGPDQVAAIRAMNGKCVRQVLADEYGVSNDTIRRIQMNMTYRAA